MKAARYYGPGDIRVEQIPEPQPKDGQVKIKIAWNGICGSDLHAFLTPMAIFPTATKPNEITGESLPITLGHEFSGTIVELGEGADSNKYSIGQHVVVEPLISCMKTNTCLPCSSGTRNICEHVNFIGIGGWGGGLAEYISVDTKYVHILPNNIPLDVAACVEPLSVAWHAVKRSGFKKGGSALVIGAGPIGLFVLKALKAIDPDATVIVSEPAAIRRELTIKHGATLALNPITEDVPAAVHAATNGNGADVALDAAGIQASLDAAILSVRPRGTVVEIALWEKEPTINISHVLMHEIVVTGVIGYDRVHPEVIEALASGKLNNIEDLITSKVAIEAVVDKGFNALIKEKDTQVKILIHP